jgi:xanthine dehydrogenase molybdopterin binding subunit
MKESKHISHHDSAIYHVTGQSVYINDIPASSMLHGRVYYSPHAHALIKSFDLEKVKNLSGVIAILSANDIPGDNQMGPVIHDEVCLADGKVECQGQAIFLIAAIDEATAIEAEKLIEIECEHLPHVLDIETAIEKGELLNTPRKIETGDVDLIISESELKISGHLKSGAQEHWYLETQSCLCVPQEGNEMKVYSSTQHPSETQAIVAEVLGINRNEVIVEVKRMGGAFGGKETQGNHVAAWSALLAQATGYPVKIHLFRDDDQIITGKRHPFLSKYQAAFTSEGKITALDVELNANGGVSNDLSMAILERAMFHIDNAYYIPNLRVIGKVWKTNIPSNTAFRGFGGPQGMAVIETVIDRIARQLNMDAARVRKLNFYGEEKNNITHYGQTVKQNRLSLLFDKLMKNSAYYELRKETEVFNNENEFYKKGLALTPVKFGISFTTSFLNQAGALVNIYRDGTVLINHGGTEMGQGLYTKMLDIASMELGIPKDRIKVSATDTSKVPNTSATAASSGSDLNGMAVKNAIDKIKVRLSQFVCQKFGIKYSETEHSICFSNGYVFDPHKPDVKISFNDLVEQAYLNQISLSATGFYKTPDIHFDKDKGRGKPFHYFAYGMAVSQVILDILTGHHEINKTFIVHDLGNSINRRIDIGQVEGGFVQGVGWCTTEEIKWDANGKQLNHSPDTYKIPGVRDIPKEFHIELMENIPNPDTIQNSKAVGEPPFMLAFSVWLAIKDAISAVGNHKFEPEFQIPATNEVILKSIEKIKFLMKTKSTNFF